eukprot:5795275-Pyramimonas_sp.AAC.1
MDAHLGGVHRAEADEPVRVHDAQQVVLKLSGVRLGRLRLVKVVVADGHARLLHVKAVDVHALAHLNTQTDAFVTRLAPRCCDATPPRPVAPECCGAPEAPPVKRSRRLCKTTGDAFVTPPVTRL